MAAAAKIDLRDEAVRIAHSAGMAPSHYNAQPWSIGVSWDTVEVWAEPTRRATVADPDGRQLMVGVGAALFAVRLELAELGLSAAEQLLPDPDRPDLAALVLVTGTRPVDAEQHALWLQVPRRRTVRAPMLAEVDPDLRRLLTSQVVAEGGRLHWVEAPGERRALAALVEMAERAQQRDPRVLGELSHWVGAQALAAGAGVPDYALGPTGEVGHAAEFPLRDFAGGVRRSEGTGTHRPEPRPVVSVLTTGADQPEDWLRAGQALMRLLLAGTSHGLAASFLNQPLEDRGLRAQVRSELSLPGPAQIVLRLGRPTGVWPPAPPRRAPQDLLREPKT